MIVVGRNYTRVQVIDFNTQVQKLFTLILGEYGTGKTRLAATAALVPELSPVLYVDCGNSADTITGEKTLRNSPIKGIKVNGVVEFEKFFNMELPKLLKENNFKTLILDDFQEIAYDITYNPTGSKKSIRTVGKWNAIRPDYDEWFALIQLLNIVVDALNKLPLNVIVNVTARRVLNETTGSEVIGASIGGQSGAMLPSKFSHVWYTVVKTVRNKEPIYSVVFKPTNLLVARVRGKDIADRLGQEMDNPSFVDIYDKLKEN